MVHFLLSYLILQTVLFAVYKLLLNRTTLISLKRIFLLAVPVVPFFIWKIGETMQIESSWIPKDSFILPETLVSKVTENTLQYSAFDLFGGISLLALIYVFVTIISLSFRIFRYVLVLRTIRKIKREGKYIAEHQCYQSSESGSFSFFNFIHLSEKLSESDIPYVLKHERTHKIKWHSLDNLYYQLVLSAVWFSPFHWWANRELKMIHEYEADREVCKAMNVRNYVRSLLSECFETFPPVLVNPFFKNKNSVVMRIKLMNEGKTPSLRRKLLIGVVFSMFVVLGVVGCATETSDKTEVSESSSNDASTEVIQPSFGDNAGALTDYIIQNFKYPEKAYDNKVEGKVFVKFIVKSNGKVSNIEIMKSADPELDEAASNLVSLMPDWNPGTKNGVPTDMEMVLPINFKI